MTTPAFKWMRLASTLWVIGVTWTPPVLAWTWDGEETVTKDELDIQVQSYRKRVEGGMSLQDRLVALNRLIRFFEIYKRDAKSLEEEREKLISDQNAIQTVSEQSRQKAQELVRRSLDEVRQGAFKQAFATVQEAEKITPSDKATVEMRQRLDSVTSILSEPPTDPKMADHVRRGVAEFAQGDSGKALNFFVYAQQKVPGDKTLSALIDLAKQNMAPGTLEMLDGRIGLIDQKLQKALEKIYSGEYLVAAKECQEVLDLEPDNALALTRLGSVYYAMGQVKQARVYWQQAMTLDPKNDVLKSFLQQTAGESDQRPAQALTYKVEKGDDLYKIAVKLYDNRAMWRKLYEANRNYLKNAYQLNAGQILVVPPLAGNR